MTTITSSGTTPAHYFETSDGLRLAYYVDDFTDPWAKASTLVMLHSANGRAQRFYGMVPLLSRHFRVVRIDLRGHGASGIPALDLPLTMERLTLDVAELVKAIGCDNVHVLGNSAGGYVGQHLAMDHSSMVDSLLLFGSMPGLKQTSRAQDARDIAKVGAREVFSATVDYHFNRTQTDPRLIDWFLAEADVNDSAYISRFVGLMGSMEWSERLHLIKCPTLVVIPGAEVERGKRSYAAMEDNIRDVYVKTYAGESHNICDAQPDRCARDALDFLNQRSVIAKPVVRQ